MQIRNRLSLYFTLFSSCLMLMVMTCVYILFYRAGQQDFYQELAKRTKLAAGVYLEADEITAEALQKIHEKFIIRLPQEILQIYDSSNSPAFIADTHSYWKPPLLEQVRVKKYLQYQDGIRQVVGIRYEDNQGSFIIMASAVDEYGRERRANLVRIMASLFFLQLVIQFLVGRWFARNTLLPIQKVNEQVKKITITDLHLRVEEGTGKDEISEMARNFNLLLERLEHAFDLQKMFVANASHELKTPVTNIIGLIEVMLHKERSAEEYKGALQSALADAERLQNIIENLLLLTTAGKKTDDQQLEAVRMDELLWEARHHFAREMNGVLKVILQSPPEDDALLCIPANKSLLLLALLNIIRNAFKFSDGREVTAVLHANEQALDIAITDTGIGIAPEALQDIFEPFYRSTQSKKYEGHGIGLYMASQIIHMYGGRIEAVSVLGRGSTFNLLFTRK